MGFSSVSNKLWRISSERTENYRITPWSTCHIFFENIRYLSCCTNCERQLSFLLNKYIFLNCQSWLPLRWPVIFYWSSRKASGRKTKTCHQRGDSSNLTCHSRRQGNVCSMRDVRWSLSVLFAPTAHVKVKSDSSLNPLWTSLTACVIWNAPLPPSQNFCHAPQSGQLLMETTLFLSGMWQRDGGICWLDASGMGGFPLWILPVQYQAARNHTGHWCGSCYWERFNGFPTTMFVQ